MRHGMLDNVALDVRKGILGCLYVGNISAVVGKYYKTCMQSFSKVWTSNEVFVRFGEKKSAQLDKAR